MLINPFIKSIISPNFLYLVKKIFSRKNRDAGFKKGLKNWQDALNNSSSYDTQDVFEKTLSAARLVRDEKAVYERDSVVFDKIQYDYQLLSSLLLIANLQNRLHLIDFGGALGTSYRQNKKYLDCLPISKKWAVVEQSEFVRIGINEFQTDILSFHDSIFQVDFDIDAVIMGSSLCYLEKPYKILGEIMKIEPHFILIFRTPFSNSDIESISIQQVPNNIYNASYPFWTLSKAKVVMFLSEKYELFEEWNDELQAYPNKSFGLLFRKKLAISE